MKNSILVALALVLAPSMGVAAGKSTVQTGRAVYESVCIACHAPENVMVAAPKLGDTTEWRLRLTRSASGIDTLTDHAIKGFGAMPAKGGAVKLSPAEARSAIEYMMAPIFRKGAKSK